MLGFATHVPAEKAGDFGGTPVKMLTINALCLKVRQMAGFLAAWLAGC